MKTIITLLALMGFFTAQAATLDLSGEIAVSCTLDSVSGNASASTLPIVAGGSDIDVGSATVSCNNGNGYKLDATSESGGFLVNDSAPNNQTAYTIEILGTGSQGAQQLTSSTKLLEVSPLSTPVSSDARTVRVDVTAVAVPHAGTYSDTVTITLTVL
jgi:spore coat protein U-like protein